MLTCVKRHLCILFRNVTFVARSLNSFGRRQMKSGIIRRLCALMARQVSILLVYCLDCCVLFTENYICIADLPFPLLPRC